MNKLELSLAALLLSAGVAEAEEPKAEVVKIYTFDHPRAIHGLEMPKVKDEASFCVDHKSDSVKSSIAERNSVMGATELVKSAIDAVESNELIIDGKIVKPAGKKIDLDWVYLESIGEKSLDVSSTTFTQTTTQLCATVTVYENWISSTDDEHHIVLK